jgi:hypothetical protein
MRRLVVSTLSMAMTACAFASAASAGGSPPAITTSFNPATVSVRQTSQLTFTLSGGDGSFSDVDLSASFPAGLNVASSSSTQCEGTLTTTPAPDVAPLPENSATEVTLSGAYVPAGGSCSFSVPVTAGSAGQLTASTDVNASFETSDVGGDVAYGTSAVLTVPATAAPAAVTSAFTPSTVNVNGTTTWTVRITNPNSSTSLTDVRFYVPTLGDGLSPGAFAANTCGGTGSVSTVPIVLGGLELNYGGGTIPPGGSCVISVSNTARAAVHSQQPVNVVTNEGGDSRVSDAWFTALAPNPGPTPTKAPSNRFTRTKPRVASDGTITETVKLPGKGKIRLGETWRGKLIAHVTKTVKTKQKLTIKLVPSASARRALKASRAATLNLSVAYTPTGGKTRTVKLTARTPR